MAEIKKFPGNYSGEGRDESKNNRAVEMNLNQKIHLHKVKTFVGALVIAAIVIIGIVLLVVYQKNIVYTKITTLNSVDRVSLESSSYINNDGSIISYSKDGISCIDTKGNTVWNMTYEMQNPIIKRSSTYVGACDINGHIIMITDMQGKTSTIDTKLPIRDFAICKEGRVAVIIDDTTNSWVYLYDVEGKKYSEIKSTMSQTGYPMSVAVSDEVVAVSYLYVDSSSMKSRVTFYNFGGLGENVTDKIVSNYEYDKVVIPVIEYLDEERIFAIADDRLLFYSGDKKPTDLIDIIINERIVGVYSGSSMVGLVFYDTSGEKKYRMDLYNKSGEKVCSYRFNMDYKDILLCSNQVIIYNESQCAIVGQDGKEKFNGLFEEPVKYIALTESSNKYIFVKENTLETVKFE